MASVFLTTGESSVTIKIRIWGNGWMVEAASLPGSNYLKLCFTNWEAKKTTVWARGNFFGAMQGRPETFKFFCFWTFVRLRCIIFIFFHFLWHANDVHTKKQTIYVLWICTVFFFLFLFLLFSVPWKSIKNWNNKKTIEFDMDKSYLPIF